MKIYSSTSLNEFLESLRDSAIKANQGPLLLDKIDALIERDPDNEDEQHEKELASEYDVGFTAGKIEGADQIRDLERENDRLKKLCAVLEEENSNYEKETEALNKGLATRQGSPPRNHGG